MQPGALKLLFAHMTGWAGAHCRGPLSVRRREHLALWFAAAAVAAVGAAALVSVRWAASELQARQHAAAISASGESPVSLGPTDASDFALALPSSAPAEPWVDGLQHLCTEHGARLTSVASQQRTATPRSLGRTELTIGLRGNFTQIKAVMHAMATLPGTAVWRRVNLRRLASPTELEAQLELWLPTRPLGAVS